MPARPKFVLSAFERLSPTHKLVWYFVRDNPREWSQNSLAAALGISSRAAYSALRELTQRGLLEVVEPGAGSRAASYKAKSGKTP